MFQYSALMPKSVGIDLIKAIVISPVEKVFYK
jgi:hypothetical protein